MENTVFKAIERRRAIYPEQFNNESVSKEEILNLIEVARFAPTHKLTEPWRFKVIYASRKDEFGKHTKDLLTEHPDYSSKADRMAHKINKSGAILIISFQRDPKESIPEWEEIAATSMAVQNMWIFAGELGLGGYWSSGKPLMYSAEKFTDFPKGERILGMFFIGKYDFELKERKHKEVEEFTSWL